MGDVSDLMREGGGELSSASDIAIWGLRQLQLQFQLVAEDHPDRADRPQKPPLRPMATVTPDHLVILLQAQNVKGVPT